MSDRQLPPNDLLVNAGLVVIFGGVTLALLAWVAGMVDVRLVHGAWPNVSPATAGAILIGIVQHPGDPAQGWPGAARHTIPGPALYWSTLLAILAAGGGSLGMALHLTRRPGSARWAHTNPRRLGYSRGADLDGGRRLPVPARSWTPSYDAWLGFERGMFGRLVPLRGRGDRQTAGVVGPPGSGKTLGLILPNLVIWTGSAIVTSTKTDILQLAQPRRLEVARQHGGDVHLIDWAELVAPIVGLQPIGFDILDGCRDSRVVSNRTEALLGATEAPHGDGADERFWKQGAGLILRPYLHAAALGRLGIGQVLEWLDQQECHEPGQIIDRENPSAAIWGDRLRGLSRSPSQVTIGGYFETAKSVFAALQEPVVLRNCQRTELDVERFLETSSTLFLIDPAGEARLSPTAPLTAALIDWIADRAYARGRRLQSGLCEPRLGLFLDELPNIAPLASLGRHLSQGSSQGVNVAFWSSQTFGQLAARFGEHEASTIWGLTRYTVLFGGGKEADWLEKVSRLAGEYEDSEETSTRTHDGRSITRQRVRRPILPVESLARIPRGEAVLVAQGRVVRILTPPAPTVRRFAAQLTPVAGVAVAAGSSGDSRPVAGIDRE